MRNRFSLTREDFIRSAIPENAVVYNQDGLEAYLYTNKQDHPCICAFSGKRSNPDLYMQYFTEEQRDKRFIDWIASNKAWQEEKKNRRARQTNPHTLKVGDILYTSWGYDQTNVEFYQVVQVKSEHTVIIREIATHTTQNGFMSGNSTPVKDKFVGPELTKRANSSNALTISECQTAWLWDGQPKYTSWYA